MSRLTTWAVLSLTALLAVGAVWVNMPPPMEQVGTYEVRPGDTLWEIAVCLDRPEDVDVRDVVSWMDDNSTASLTIGQTVALPYKYTTEGSRCRK